MEGFKQVLKGLFITLGVIAIFVAAVVIYQSYRDYIDRATASASVNGGSHRGGSSQLAESDYDDLSIPFVNEKDSYRKMMFGDLPKGIPVVLIGKVDQVIQGNELRVATGTFDDGSLEGLVFSGMGFVNRHVLISTLATPRALVGDFIAIKGRYMGTVEYKTVVGDIVKVPSITADYYEANSSIPELSDFFAGRRAASKQLGEQQQEYEQRQSAQQSAEAARQAAQMPIVGSEFDPENGVAEAGYSAQMNEMAIRDQQKTADMDRALAEGSFTNSAQFLPPPEQPKPAKIKNAFEVRIESSPEHFEVVEDRATVHAPPAARYPGSEFGLVPEDPRPVSEK